MTKIADLDPNPDSDPLVRGMDPRIRIRTKMSWIRNTAKQGVILNVMDSPCRLPYGPYCFPRSGAAQLRASGNSSCSCCCWSITKCTYTSNRHWKSHVACRVISPVTHNTYRLLGVRAYMWNEMDTER